MKESIYNIGIRLCFLSFIFFFNLGMPLAQERSSTDTAKTDKTRVNQINLNLRDADILSVLEFYSELMNKTFLPSDKLKGKVTIISPRPLSVRDAKKLLYSILDMKGFAVVETADCYKIVKKKEAIQDGLKVSPKDIEGDQIYTEIINLKYAEAQSILRNIRPILSPESVVFAGEDFNFLVITDTAANIFKIKTLVNKIDLPTSLPETRAFHLQYIKADDVMPVLSDLLQKSKNTGGFPAKVMSLKETNTLVITASTADHQRIKSIITQLDIRTMQVSIAAKIVEVTLDEETKMGFEWNWMNESGTAKKISTTMDAGNILKTNTEGPAKILGEAFKFSFLKIDKFEGLMNMLASDRRIKVISTPHIIAMDNQEAKLRVGDEIPIIKEMRLDTNNNPIRTFDQIKTGLELTITPRIAENRDVTMKIKQKLSNLSSYDPETYSYQLSDREASTSVVVKDKHTLVIGGLIANDNSRSDTGIPFLRKIPVLGKIFGRESTATTKRELLIFLTPTVIENPKEGKMISREEKVKHPLVVDEGGIEFDL